jgi:hypothetical protein
MGKCWHGIHGGLAVAMDAPDWGGIAVSPEAAAKLCGNHKGNRPVRAWTQRRWRRFFQGPPNMTFFRADDQTTCLISLRENVWIDMPMSQHKAVRPLSAKPMSDPGPIIQAMNKYSKPGILIHILQELRAIEVTSCDGRSTEEFSYTFLHVDARASDPYGISLGTAIRDETLITANIELLVADAGARAKNLSQASLGIRDCGSTMCIAPTCGELIHEIVGHVCESLAPSRERSWISIGQRATNAEVSIYDDPQMRDGFANRFIDDTGEKTNRVILIDKGIVADGFSTDGCWIRGSPNAPLKRRATNLIVRGKSTDSDILRETWEGVYVSQIGNAYFDSNNGVFQIVVTEARRIKQGQLEDPIRPFRICASPTSTLERIAALGSDYADNSFFCVTRYGPTRSSVQQPSIVVEDFLSTSAYDEP